MDERFDVREIELYNVIGYTKQILAKYLEKY